MRDWENKLIAKYPEMFKYREDEASLMKYGFAVEDGWRSIVEILTGLIYQTVTNHNKRVDTYNSLVNENATTILNKYWSNFNDKIIDYPQVEQVKEKFGGLRYYIGPLDKCVYDEIDGLITMAEFVSFTICEECGNKGFPRKRSWVRTLCKKCAIDTILMRVDLSKEKQQRLLNDVEAEEKEHEMVQS